MSAKAGARPRVAVVGGGMAGLSCARVLLRHGIDVMVFDKARKPGGRLSTRRTTTGLTFDHGAQYFTIRNPWFRRALEPMIDAGAVARWDGRLAVAGPDGAEPEPAAAERWVGVPTMSALPRALGEGVPVEANTRVTGLRRDDEQWILEIEDGRRRPGFDRVVIAIPAEQAAALLGKLPALRRVAEAVPMAPCWAVMVELEDLAMTGYDGAFIRDSALSWVMRQPSKPERPRAEAWVLHATATWTEAHWSDDPHHVISSLLDAWRLRGGPAPGVVSDARAHRWRYALVDREAEIQAVGDDEAGVALAGDWLGGGRVEGAFLSGRRAAAGVLRSLR